MIACSIMIPMILSTSSCMWIGILLSLASPVSILCFTWPVLPKSLSDLAKTSWYLRSASKSFSCSSFSKLVILCSKSTSRLFRHCHTMLYDTLHFTFTKGYLIDINVVSTFCNTKCNWLTNAHIHVLFQSDIFLYRNTQSNNSLASANII